MLVGIHDLITYETFGDDQLRGLGVARGRISVFPIDLRRRPAQHSLINVDTFSSQQQ